MRQELKIFPGDSNMQHGLRITRSTIWNQIGQIFEPGQLN